MSKYVDRRAAERSYRPKAGTMSASLKRARQPFLIPNAVTGTVLMGFAVGVYVYSIRAVKQDEFEDVDEVAKARAKEIARSHAASLSKAEESGIMEAAIANMQAKKP
ncbi:hypothetical protein CYLTODRAFT_25069 [Cylindrobasidium torrendii FP15055 ss-10]|uniref:Cytochrome c oxidase assembly factor 3 n=1 Tax=Cylindrobasidium torrendii FP15055 ss-10 TaxID=1314674 RepID=A0A0D7B912_9AGAR|nr:hypothetical protein CYLTODRAFT_25069 [Cylindrobasidium torrendii FP15055 ss-10]